jgi:enoyl-[acyl-carrier protein] reductase I
MGLVDGKTGLVFGVATGRSYAWHITKALVEHGARCAFGVLPGDRSIERAHAALAELGLTAPWIGPCDAARDADLDAFFAAYAADHDRLDFVIHSIAFAAREWLVPGRFAAIPRQEYLQAIDVSAYSLVAMAQRARPLMAGRGGAIVAMTYAGSERVVSGYGVMGVAKAALECSARYLAAELGPDGIRVNTISGGALRTPAASAIRNFNALLGESETLSPLRRSVRGEDVGHAAAFLVSDLAEGITAENVHVDCGISAMGSQAASRTTGS